jgi:hypothetical protein
VAATAAAHVTAAATVLSARRGGAEGQRNSNPAAAALPHVAGDLSIDPYLLRRLEARRRYRRFGRAAHPFLVELETHGTRRRVTVGRRSPSASRRSRPPRAPGPRRRLQYTASRTSGLATH